MAIRYVSVEVEVDMSDFSDDDIEAEAEERGLSTGAAMSDELTELYYAFKLGRTDRAMELAKQLASEHMGMILC